MSQERPGRRGGAQVTGRQVSGEKLCSGPSSAFFCAAPMVRPARRQEERRCAQAGTCDWQQFPSGSRFQVAAGQCG